MSTSSPLLDKAKVLVLFGMCLFNPFAGWAYLAQSRPAEALRPAAISDRLNPRRLAILPVVVASGGSFDAEWGEAFEVDFADLDDLEVVAIRSTSESLDPERDVLSLGRGAHADYLLDASAVVDGPGSELRLYVRLIRMADARVPWSQLFVGEIEELPLVRERIRVSILRAL